MKNNKSERKVSINNSSYEEIKKITNILKYDETKQMVIRFVSEITGFKLTDIEFNGIEKFQSIAEYDFYLINLIGITENRKRRRTVF